MDGDIEIKNIFDFEYGMQGKISCYHLMLNIEHFKVTLFF